MTEISDHTILSDLYFSTQRKIDNLERAPSMWGSPESQEFTMLSLVGLRAKLLRPKTIKEDPYEVRDAWTQFIASINGECTNTFLHIILKREEKLEMLGTLLGDAARWILKEYPAERNYQQESTDPVKSQ